MPVPAWFVYNSYLESHLEYLRANDPDHWIYATTADLERLLSQSGYGGEDGAYRHFLNIGAKQGINPNKYFNANAYCVFKTAKDNNIAVGDVTPAQVNMTRTAIENAGYSMWSHFTKWGTREMVTASNNFDTERYLTDKLYQLWATDPDNWVGKTVADVGKAISARDMNAVMHYMMYGVGEGLEAHDVPLGDMAWLDAPADWTNIQNLLHNEVYCIGDRQVQNINLPKYYDILLQVTPACIGNEDAGYGLAFNNSLVDLKTGSLAEFLLHPRASQIGLLPIQTFTRDQYNRVLDFCFMIEGRYMSFWTSLCIPCYKPLLYGEPYFPEILDMEYIFGEGPEGQRNYFYALNWGQGELFETTKDRMLAFYADGFTKCYWAKPMKIEVLQDPRIIRVDIRDPLPRIDLHRLDLVTEYLYVRAKTDEFPFEFTTNTITNVQIEFQEDIEHSYDPWLSFPTIYPDMDNAAAGLPPSLDITKPSLIQTTPGNGATNVNVLSTIIFTFNEPILQGSGGTIIVVAGENTWVMTPQDNRISFSGKSCVINMGEALPYLTPVTVTLDGLCVQDMAGNYWDGNESNPLKFTTASEFKIDNEPPHLISHTPASGDKDVDPTTTLVLQFNESVQPGGGYIVVATDDNDGDGYADHSITVMATACHFLENGKVEVPLSENLHRDTAYHVTITSTAFKDAVGNQYEGISDIDEWDFTTKNIPMVWFIPGLDTSITSPRVRQINKAFEDKLSLLEWWPMDNFESNWNDLKEATTDLRATDVIIGESMGGFYAAHLAATVGCGALLLNPVVNPATQCQSLIGTRIGPSGQQYKLTQGLLDSYDAATDPRVPDMRKHFGLYLALNDELINPEVAQSYYSGWTMFVDTTANGHVMDTDEEIEQIVKLTKEMQDKL